MCKLKSALLLMLICLFCGQVPLQADSGWNIRIYRLQHAVRTMLGGDKAVCDGKEMPLAAASFKQEGVAYLPLRSVTCLADAEVGWNSRMRRAELTFADKRGLRTVAGFGAGDDRAFFGDASADAYSEKMGYPSILQQGRLFVPARYLALLLNMNLHYSNGELIFYWNENKAETTGLPSATDKAEEGLTVLCANGVDSPDLVVWRGQTGQGILKRDGIAKSVIMDGKRYDSFEPVLQLEPGANIVEIFAGHVSTGVSFTINCLRQ